MLSVICSCHLPKVLKDGEYLLDANKIRTDVPELKEGMMANIKQKPNRKILGTFKFHLTVYRLGSSFRKTNRFSAFLTNKIGERPETLDSQKCENSIRQLQIFMRNNGYYQSEISYSVKSIDVKNVLRLATVIYNVKAGERLYNSSIQYIFSDSDLASHFEPFQQNGLIKVGDPFYTGKFIEERERISLILRNKGYYFFNKDYILYEVDTFSNKANVKIFIKNSSERENHRIYKIGSINVFIDTLVTKIISTDCRLSKQIKFYLNGYKLKTDLLVRGFKIFPGDIYIQDSVEETYLNLLQLQLFKFINIRFDVADSSNAVLNCTIRLSPKLRQDITWEPTLTMADQPNSNNITNQPYRNYGIANIFSYTNNNLLKQADIFKARLRNTFEIQFRDTGSAKNRYYFSLENSLNLSLNLPGRSPLGFIRKPKNINNSSQLTASIIFEKNRDFDRRLLVLGYAYNFKIRRFPNCSFTWMPVELSYIKTENLSAVLNNLLNKPEGAFLKSLFGKNFIQSSRLSFVYINPGYNMGKNQFVLRYTPVELAGNILNWLVTKPDPIDSIKRIFGVRFFTYYKTEVDLRYSYSFTRELKFATRLFAGVGIPYASSSVMPYEKRYFSGGSVSLRGWRPRTLGPGGFNDINNPLNRTGDMKLEFNAELRFPLGIYKKYFEGAVFMDAGNIWNIYYLKGYEKADFGTSSLKDEMAVDAGAGIRLIFPFFIVRADAAIPLRDPGLEPGRRRLYMYKYTSIKDLRNASVLSFGIGYPF